MQNLFFFILLSDYIFLIVRLSLKDLLDFEDIIYYFLFKLKFNL